MKTPLISFIISDYDLPIDMLRECIESILALSLDPSEREIIVVDDGSKNIFANELSKYERDIIYIRQSHQGLSSARNNGIQMAKGEYLQFVDGDDKLVTSPYNHCVDVIRQKKSDMTVFDFTKKKPEYHQYSDTFFHSGSYYMRHNNIRGTACGYIFKKSILGNLRFTTGIYHEDEEFTPQLLLRSGNICVTNAKAYFYRERPNSIITDNNIRNRIKRLSDLKNVIIRLSIVADRLTTDDKSALQRRVAQLTMDYIYRIITQTKSRNYLTHKIEELRKEGLYPLPEKDYTAKYSWFRRLSNSQTGQNILLRLLPLLKEER